MDQSELNGIVQKWLEGLQQLQQPEQKLSDFGPLPADGEQELVNVLEKLSAGLKITGTIKTSLHAGGTHLAVLARSLSCYLSVALEQKSIDLLAGMIHTHVSRNLINIIGLDTGDKSFASMFHDDVCDGFVRAIQMALFKKYDKMAIEGIMCTANKPPVIYVSMRGEISLLQQVCIRVGLPQSCITPVACSTLHGSTHTIDTEALEKQINEDCNVGKTPLAVIAYAGTPLAGHVDDLVSIKTICDQNNMWLHVTGHGLSSLCIPEERNQIKGFEHVDSFTLFPATWFGLLSTPMVTLHKHPKVIQLTEIPSSTNFPPGDNVDISNKDILIPSTSWYAMYHHGLPKLLSLSLWICMEYLGSAALVDTVSYCRSLTKNMMIRLDEIPGVVRLAIPSHTSYVVLFKYNGSGQLILPPSLKKLLQPKPLPPKSEAEKSEEQQEPPPPSEKDDDDDPLVVTIHGMPLVLTNMYNIMISKDLNVLFPKVGIATYDMGNKGGVVFRFDPITSFPEYSTSVEDIEKFTEEFKNKVNELHQIAQARCLFEVALKNQSNLRWLEFPNIHCVAIIQYVKSEYLEKQDLTVEEVNSLNKFNAELSQHLNQFAAVFQPFQHGNFTCLLIRELPKEMAMFKLLETLLTETNNFVKQKEELQGMEEKIRQGILAAQEDLTKEKEKAEGEESVLKHMPIIGSVVSWLYPTSPTGLVGRSFNLSSGKIEASSKVYEHRMQLFENETTEKQVPPVANDTPSDKSSPEKTEPANETKPSEEEPSPPVD